MAISSPVFVVTAVHNRREITQAFARRLASQTLPGIHLVVVDDGSTDGTADAVRGVYGATTILTGSGHLWWGGSLHKAVTWLRAQNLPDSTVVVFMNDDVSFDDEFFARAVEELRGLPSRSFLVAPGVFSTSGRLSEEAGVTDWSRFKIMHYGDRPDRIDHATTRSLLMLWADLKGVGGFHPTLVPHYTSDYIFTMTAHRQGIRLVPAKSVCAKFSDETTGDHGLGTSRGWARVRKMFSPRFSYNPLHQAFFVWYICPWYYKIPCWARILVTAVKHLR